MKKDILYILMLMMTAVGLSSCNEDNNTPDEYPDWKARNEEYFNKIYKEAVSDAKTDPNVKVIRNWSLPETHNNPEDFISRPTYTLYKLSKRDDIRPNLDNRRV